MVRWTRSRCGVWRSRGKEEERSHPEGQGFIYTVFTDELRLHLIHQKQASSDGASKVDIQSNEHLKKHSCRGPWTSHISAAALVRHGICKVFCYFSPVLHWLYGRYVTISVSLFSWPRGNGLVPRVCCTGAVFWMPLETVIAPFLATFDGLRAHIDPSDGTISPGSSP